jgi:hypothetical protein
MVCLCCQQCDHNSQSHVLGKGLGQQQLLGGALGGGGGGKQAQGGGVRVQVTGSKALQV